MENETNVTSASQWKKKSGDELSLPSGNVCLARRPGIDIFIKKGMIPNSLMPLVQEMLNENKPPSQRAAENIDVTPELIEQMSDLYNSICIYAVVEPKVFNVPMQADPSDPSSFIPVPEDERDQVEGLYVDEVDFDDKQFIFQWALGGTSDLEKFRAEQADDVEPVQPSQDLERETESVSAN